MQSNRLQRGCTKPQRGSWADRRPGPFYEYVKRKTGNPIGAHAHAHTTRMRATSEAPSMNNRRAKSWYKDQEWDYCNKCARCAGLHPVYTETKHPPNRPNVQPTRQLLDVLYHLNRQMSQMTTHHTSSRIIKGHTKFRQNRTKKLRHQTALILNDCNPPLLNARPGARFCDFRQSVSFLLPQPKPGCELFVSVVVYCHCTVVVVDLVLDPFD